LLDALLFQPLRHAGVVVVLRDLTPRRPSAGLPMSGVPTSAYCSTHVLISMTAPVIGLSIRRAPAVICPECWRAARFPPEPGGKLTRCHLLRPLGFAYRNSLRGLLRVIAVLFSVS